MDLNSILSSDIVKQIAGAAGASEGSTKNVLESALPMLIGGEQNSKKVTKATKKATGESSSAIANILSAAGPILSGVLGGGLSGLDSDGDGKIDLGGIISTVFGGSSSGGSSSGGILSLLGGLFGGSSSGTAKKKTAKK